MALSITVEDGTGLAAANSYISTTTGDGHLEELRLILGLSTDPTLTDLDCVSASQYLDAEYGGRWRGTRANDDQGLDWPRNGVVDADGYEYDNDELPTELEQATAVMAYYAQNESGGIMPNQSDPGIIKRIKKKVGPIEKDVEYQGGNPVEKYFRLAESILLAGQLIRSGSEVRRA